MVYAPIEGRFLGFDAFWGGTNASMFDREEIEGTLTWKTQGHKKDCGFLFTDDFEIDEPFISEDLEYKINILLNAAADLVFERNPSRSRRLLVFIRDFSRINGVESIGLYLASSSMAYRRNMISRG